MASLDLSASTSFPVVANTTLSGTPGNVRLVLLPTHVDVKVSIRPRTSDAKLVTSQSVTEDSAIGATAYGTLDGDTWQEVGVPSTGGCSRLGIASTDASVVVEVLVERIVRPL